RQLVISSRYSSKWIVEFPSFFASAPAQQLSKSTAIGPTTSNRCTRCTDNLLMLAAQYISFALGGFPYYCTVTMTVVVREIVPDWAVTMIEAVPRFGCVLPPYPPQPPIASPKATIASTAVAVSHEARPSRRFRLR